MIVLEHLDVCESQDKGNEGKDRERNAEGEEEGNEVLATHPSYQGRSLGSMLLQAGCEMADLEAIEIYLEGTKKAQPLYESFGFVDQAECKDEKASSPPVLRAARRT
jgi:GNAT superfamily N-acetyltransferase